MRILIDTNVIMDIIQRREPFFADSYQAFRKAIENDVECLISASAISRYFPRLVLNSVAVMIIQIPPFEVWFIYCYYTQIIRKYQYIIVRHYMFDADDV